MDNLTDHLRGAQIYAKVVSEANGGLTRFIMQQFTVSLLKKQGKKYIVGDTGAGYAGKMLSMAAVPIKCKNFMGAKDIKRQRPNGSLRKNGENSSCGYR